MLRWGTPNLDFPAQFFILVSEFLTRDFEECFCLGIKSSFLPSLVSTPSVRPDSLSWRDTDSVVTDCETGTEEDQNIKGKCQNQIFLIRLSQNQVLYTKAKWKTSATSGVFCPWKSIKINAAPESVKPEWCHMPHGLQNLNCFVFFKVEISRAPLGPADR